MFDRCSNPLPWDPVVPLKLESFWVIDQEVFMDVSKFLCSLSEKNHQTLDAHLRNLVQEADRTYVQSLCVKREPDKSVGSVDHGRRSNNYTPHQL